MRNRIKGLAAGAVAIVLAGCGGGGGGSAPASAADIDLSSVDHSGTVSVMTRYAGHYESFFKEMKAEYEAAHPDVTVELQQESDQGYKDKIKALTASQSLPDVYFSWAGSYAEQFYDNGLALDLTSVLAPGTEWGDSMVPSALEAFHKDDQYYGVPFGLDAKFVVYNQALFAKAGASVPTTFEQLIDTCKTLDAAGITPMSFGNIDGWPALHYITQLNSYNVPPETLAKDFVPETATFEDPGYLQSYEQFGQILDSCTATGASANGTDYYSERDAFGSGDAAMFYVENLEFGATVPAGSQAEKDGWGEFQLPAPEGAKGDPGALTGAPDAFLVNPRAEDPALAVDFMRFVTSQENGAKLTAEMGIPSPVTGALTEANSTPQLRASVEALQNASSLSIWLDTVTVPEVADAFLSGTEGFISGSKTAEDVMASVQAASEAAK